MKIQNLHPNEAKPGASGGALRRMRLIPTVAGIVVPLLFCAPVPGFAQSASSASRDLTQVSLEDLMNIEVTSVSKKEQKLSKTAAAVFVITQEDIRTSGAANIPDLLRMVPGVDVAQITSNTWAIAIRGFNS